VSEEETLTIRQAATLLNVHPNTVRNRIKSGAYRAEKVITERGQTYVIPRYELSKDLDTNNPPSASHSQPLPDVRETMRAMLEPFVRELGEVREELGRERERRERAEAELSKLLEARESAEAPAPTETPQQPQAASSPLTWWQRIFGGSG
jgi:excisionase family DNA binding protein